MIVQAQEEGTAGGVRPGHQAQNGAQSVGLLQLAGPGIGRVQVAHRCLCSRSAAHELCTSQTAAAWLAWHGRLNTKLHHHLSLCRRRRQRSAWAAAAWRRLQQSQWGALRTRVMLLPVAGHCMLCRTCPFQACKLHRHANRLLTGWQFAASASDCFCCCSLRSVAVYYHPTLNPMGIPPPGKPQK